MHLKSLQHRVVDGISKDRVEVYHSTHSREELAEVVLENRFYGGRSGGAMLGRGFYANQNLSQAQKGNYGRNIVKAEIFGISNFLFLDKDTYEEIHGPAPEDFIYQQIAPIEGYMKAVGKEWGINKNYLRPERNGATSSLATFLWDRLGSILKREFFGMVYTGSYDAESIVCWFPEKCVRIIGVSTDKGETWNSVKSAREVLSEKKGVNLRKSEDVRSLQRALDIVERYQNHPDEKLANAMNSQLVRVTDPAKRQIRKSAFIEVLEEKRPSVVPLLD